MREETQLHGAPAPARLTLERVGAGTGRLRIHGKVESGRVEELATTAARLLTELAAPIVCDVAGIEEPNGAAVDLLARIRLAACTHGVSVSFANVSSELDGLLAMSGLRGVLPYAT